MNDTATLLTDIRSHLEKNETREALGKIVSLRVLLPRNIFVVGLQTQVEKLCSAEAAGGAEVVTLRNTLPPLMERVVESTANPASGKKLAQPVKTSGKSDREKAIESLKAQYYGHADTFMRKGEYEKAADEVRRVQLLDPNDANAGPYLQKLEELIKVDKEDAARKKTLAATVAQRQSREGKTATATTSLNELVTMMQPNFDSIIAKNGDSTIPERNQSVEESAPRSSRRHVPGSRSKATSFLFGSAFFIILAIAVSYFISIGNEQGAVVEEQQMNAVHVPTPARVPTTDSVSTTMHHDTTISIAIVQSDSIHQQQGAIR
jgi:hypothetical protein